MKQIDPNSRTQRILRFIAASTKPVSHDDVVAAVRAYAEDAKTKNLGNKVSATLAGLVDLKKVKRSGAPRDYRFSKTPTTLAGYDDTKAVSDSPTAPAASSEVPRVTAAERECAANARRPGEFRIVPNANLTRPRESALDSEQIAADIAAFQARGGRIQRFKPGESSQSIREQNDAYLAARGQGLAKQRAAARIATRAHASNDETLDADDQADVA
jgi:hypothetical protein